MARRLKAVLVTIVFDNGKNLNYRLESDSKGGWNMYGPDVERAWFTTQATGLEAFLNKVRLKCNEVVLR